MRYEDKVLLVRRIIVVCGVVVWTGVGVAFARLETPLDWIVVGTAAANALVWLREMRYHWYSQ